MNRPSSHPVSRRSRVRRLGLLALAALVLAVPTPARAGWDDFEFGQRLIEKGYLEYAKRVFETILNDEKRPQQERDRARYGMALLGKADAVTAVNNPALPWSEATNKLDAAIDSIDAFVKKFPDDPQADKARFETAGMQQWFVEQASDLSSDAERLAARGTKAGDVLEGATRYADRAIQTYKWLSTNAKLENDRALANYYLAVMGYYKALTAPKCSTTQLDGLKQAQKILEDYAFDNDGKLTQVFAQDFQGQALWAVGDCLSGKEQWQTYQKAMSMFIACASTEDQGDDHRKVIALGYYHIGRLANAVAKTDEVVDNPTVTEREVRELLKEARRHLGDLERRAGQSRLDRMDFGLRAMVQWGLVEWRLGAGDEAIRILNKASELATANGLTHVAAMANAALARVARGSAGGDLADALQDRRERLRQRQVRRGDRRLPATWSSRVVARTENLVKYYLSPGSASAQCYGSRSCPSRPPPPTTSCRRGVPAAASRRTSAEDAIGRIVVEAFNRTSAARSRRSSTARATRSTSAAATTFTARVDRAAAEVACDGGGGQSGPRVRARPRDVQARRASATTRSRPRTRGRSSFRTTRAVVRQDGEAGDQERVPGPRVGLPRARRYRARGEFDAVKAVDGRSRLLGDARGEGARSRATRSSRRCVRKAQVAAVTYWKAAGRRPRAGRRRRRPDERPQGPRRGFTCGHGDGGEYQQEALGLRGRVLARAGQGRRGRGRVPRPPHPGARLPEDPVHRGEARQALPGRLEGDPGQADRRRPDGADRHPRQPRRRACAQRIAVDKEEIRPCRPRLRPEPGGRPSRAVVIEVDKNTPEKEKFGEAEKKKKELVAEGEAARGAEEGARRLARSARRSRRSRSARRSCPRSARRCRSSRSRRCAAPPSCTCSSTRPSRSSTPPAPARSVRSAENVAQPRLPLLLPRAQRSSDKPEDWRRRGTSSRHGSRFAEVKALPETTRTAAPHLQRRWARSTTASPSRHHGRRARSLAYENAVKHLQPYAARNPANGQDRPARAARRGRRSWARRTPQGQDLARCPCAR